MVFPNRDNAPMLTLRRAVPDDEERLLGWRNEPSTRDASFTPDEISTEEHHRWFARKLANPSCALLIIEDAGQAVGQVRLDRVDPDTAEVSIGLAPEARGRGLGRTALQLAASEASKLLGVRTVRAFVRQGNPASLHAFRAAGFSVVGDDGSSIELLRESDSDECST
jgi:RimJ/RimL family protein N-acetyltransferase